MTIRSYSKLGLSLAFCLGSVALVSCSSSSSTSNSNSNDGAGSEIATSVVSGSLNNGAGSKVSANDQARPKAKSGIDWLFDKLNPIGTAWAATWNCSGGSLNPTFAGPGSYTYTPLSCSVTWAGGKTAQEQWSSTFNLNYDTSCDATHAFIQNQAASCQVTRTTGSNGNTRTITGPDGNAYSVTHDTNGQGTGWDSSVMPAPSNAGLTVDCGALGCVAGGTLTINGSHITGTLTPSGGTASKWWDHTVTTSPGGVTVVINGTDRVVTGTVVVQHNLAKFTSTTTFNSVEYNDETCCFPTGGSVTTTFSEGPYQGKTESLTFGGTGATCGDSTLTKTDGTKEAFTLKHCI